MSEFIILTPQGAYPFNVIPSRLVDILFLDGEKRGILFPYDPEKQGVLMQSRDMPAVYRVRLHKDEPGAAMYFHPQERLLQWARSFSSPPSVRLAGARLESESFAHERRAFLTPVWEGVASCP